MDGTNGNNPNNPDNNADANANLRSIVQNLVSEIKDKQDLLGAKNVQIRDLLSRLERVNQRLGEKDNTIDELKKKLDNTVPELIRNSDTLPEGCTFPVEVFDIIFHHSSASTRVNLAATNYFFHQRYHQWKDVTSIYITRQPIKNLPKATIIPHNYLIRTNIPSVASFSSSNLISMAPSLLYVKQMLIESNQNRLSTEFNRIPMQCGFFSYFTNMEYVKIVNVTENLSLRYNLNELLALPHLKILHIREHRIEFTLPESRSISAPIEQLRTSIAYRNPEKLESFLEALSPTLTSLDFSTLRNFMPINGFATSQIGAEVIPAVTSKCAELGELHIPSIISRHASFDSTLPLLKKLTKLKRISFEIMHLSALVNIVENLSPTCESLVITDNFYIRGDVIVLSSGSTKAYDKLFNGNNYELLQFECNRIHRNLIIQLGRFRGNKPLTILRNVTSTIQIISNLSPEPKLLLSNPQERRVYLSDGIILTREEYLAQMGIVPIED